jgi:hypothetical protein
MIGDLEYGSQLFRRIVIFVVLDYGEVKFKPSQV